MNQEQFRKRWLAPPECKRVGSINLTGNGGTLLLDIGRRLFDTGTVRGYYQASSLLSATSSE